jgi:hypothetical protein
MVAMVTSVPARSTVRCEAYSMFSRKAGRASTVALNLPVIHASQAARDRWAIGPSWAIEDSLSLKSSRLPW